MPETKFTGITTEMSRILLISHQLDYSGAPNALLSSARVMRGMGVEIDLLALAEGPLELDFQSIGVRKIRDTSFKGYEWIILNTAVSARISKYIPREAKYCLWIHESPFLFVHSDLPLYVAEAARRASGLIFPSESTANEWAHYGALRSEGKSILHLLSPVTLPNEFEPTFSGRAIEPIVRLVTIDPVEFFRGHRVIAKAINQLQSTGYDVHYTAIGASEAQTKTIFPNLRLDRITATDRVPRAVALRYLAQGHIYLSASAFATQNLGLCEASLLGIPSVVSDIPVHRAWADKLPGSVFTYPLFDELRMSELLGQILQSYLEHARLAKLRSSIATDLLSERRFASALKSFLNF